jgi:hypothetical protein
MQIVGQEVEEFAEFRSQISSVGASAPTAHGGRRAIVSRQPLGVGLREGDSPILLRGLGKLGQSPTVLSAIARPRNFARMKILQA